MTNYSTTIPLLFYLVAAFTHLSTLDTTLTGTLIVLNKSDNTAMLIDRASGAARAMVPTGKVPHEVAVSPDGNWAVVSNYGSREVPGNTLTVIDIRKGSKRKGIDLGEYHRPHGLAWLKEGSRLLVTVESEKSLLVVDVDSGKVVKAIRTDQDVSHMVVGTADDRRAFVANIGSGSVTVIDLERDSVIKSIPTGAGAEGIALSPDGKELWVTNRDGNNVSVIDTKTLAVVDSLHSESFPIRVKFTPEGEYALVSNARSGNVTVFDVKQRKEIKKISFEVEAVSEAQQRLFGDRFNKSPIPIGIVIPPDGKLAYVANSNADVIAVVDLSMWKVTGWIKVGREPDGLGFSSVMVQGSSRE
ncbi:MAG: cytochrome D1 domain-containing protein [Bacteroidota bacterium]